MTTKSDIIAAVTAAADAYFVADPETGRAVFLSLGTAGTKLIVAEQPWWSGGAWAQTPGVLETIVEGLAAWLDAHGVPGGPFSLDVVLATGNDGGAIEITNIADPTAAQSAVTLAYLQAVIAALPVPDLTDVLTSGNDAGALEIVNLGAPTTASSAATRGYVDALVGWTRLDGFDNATDSVTLGSLATDRAWIVDYEIDLQTSHRAHVGQLRVDSDGTTPHLTDDDYSFDKTEIAGLSWSLALVAGAAELRLTKTLVGENTTLRYRIHHVAVTP